MTIIPRKSSRNAEVYAPVLDWSEDLVRDLARRAHGIAEQHDISPESVLLALAKVFSADIISRGNN